MSQNNGLHPEVIKQNTVIYNDYYKEGVVDGWEAPDKAYNFTNLTRIEKLTKIPLKGKNILDVGCGSGDFVTFLRTFAIKKYLGIDIYEPALTIARKKYPQERFVNEDILSPLFRKKFDYVFCSGALSLKLESLDNYYFLRLMLTKMWKTSKIGIAFNLLSDEDLDPDEHLFYYDIQEVIKICKLIAPQAEMTKKKTPIPSEGRLDNIQYHFFVYRG